MKTLSRFAILACIPFLIQAEAFAGRTKVWPLKEDVPAQQLLWSCGVHAACTLMRSEGLDVTFNEVLKDCPKYNVFGFDIGPDPTKLANHMTKVCGNKTCYEAVRLQEASEEQALEGLRVSLMKGPTIILVKTGVQGFFGFQVVQLHNLLVYGFDEDRNEFYIYDTDKSKATLNSEQIVQRWFWDTSKQGNPEFNPMVHGVLSGFGTHPKMMIRASIKLEDVKPVDDDKKANDDNHSTPAPKKVLTAEEQEEEDIAEAIRLSSLVDSLD